MRLRLITVFSIILLWIGSLPAWSQDADEIRNALAKTWYGILIGDLERGEMNPKERSEVLTLSADGTLNIKEGEMSLDGQWEYVSDSHVIAIEMEFQGNKQAFELTIGELTEYKLTLIDSARRTITEYSTSPPDPNAPKPKKAPTVVVSASTIDGAQWTGLHPFNRKISIFNDGKTEKIESVGVLILLTIDGKKILRINDDGLTTDVEVSEGTEMANERHFGLQTEDPELAGEIVFRNDGSFYLYLDKNESTVEFVNE